MSDKPLDVYVLFDAVSKQKFIKVADDGCLAIFDNEASAKAAKRRHPGTDYRQVNYYSQKQVDRLQSDNEALRARVAELESLFEEGFNSGDDHDLEAWEGRAKTALSAGGSQAWLLRNQADAVEACDTKLNSIPGAALWDMDQVQQWLGTEAQRLRNSAEQLERGGSDD